MIRAVSSGLVVLSLAGTAPLQCGGGGHETAAREPSAGDALWDLAQDFRKQGNEAAARSTLKYLVDHFPSNRHAEAARAELQSSGAK